MASSSSRNQLQSQSHDASRLDVVPDYEKLLILDRSDESIFEQVDLEQHPAHAQDSVHSLSGVGHHSHPRSRSSTGNSPSATIMKSGARQPAPIVSTRQPLQDEPPSANRERQASNSLAPAPVRLAQAQVSLSWTDILRPLMDDDTNRLDKITAPLGVQNAASVANQPSTGENNHPALASSKHPASAPASRAGTVRRERSRSPNRERAYSHAQQPPSPVLGTLADGRVASPKISTRRDRSPSPDAALTQKQNNSQAQQQQPQRQSQPHQQQQSSPPEATIKIQAPVSLQRDPSQHAQMTTTSPAALPITAVTTQNTLRVNSTNTNDNSAPPSPSSSRRTPGDYTKDVQPKVDTWRVESPTARRRAQEAAEREAQRQREEQAQREMEEFHRQQLERMREAERRRKVDAETHVCSLDFLVSVGAEAKQEPPEPPAAKQVQPKVDTWWREGRPRSPTMERANRPQIAALNNAQQQSTSTTSDSGAQAGTTLSPSRTRKTWGISPVTGVGTSALPASTNVNSNASGDPSGTIDEHSKSNQQQQREHSSTMSQSQQPERSDPPQSPKPQQVVQRPPSPKQSRQSHAARPPSPSQSRAATATSLSVNTTTNSNDASESSTSPSSPGRKPRSPRPSNLTIETNQPIPAAAKQQRQGTSSPRSASLSRASARKISSQLDTQPTIDSAVVSSALPASPTTRSRSRSTSANTAQSPVLDESHGPTRAFLQQQSQHILNDHVAVSPTKRQPSGSALLSPSGTLQRSRKSSSASVGGSSVSFAGGDGPSVSLRKQQRELDTVTSVGAAGGPPAVLTIQARSWRSYVMHEGAYVALLAVFLLLAFDTLTRDHDRAYKTGCVKIARHLSNTGEVVCHD